jgi:hypothetical protein
MTKEVMKQEQDDSVSYIKEVIEALYENSDPVSVEAAELLERINAKQEQDEPVAWEYEEYHHAITGQMQWFPEVAFVQPPDEPILFRKIKPLYTKPQQRKPLTSEQIDEIYFDSTLDIDRQYNQLYAFARAIEAAHGIKE